LLKDKDNPLLPHLTFSGFLMQGGSSRRIGRKHDDETFITIASKYGFDGERQRERMERRAQKLRDRRGLNVLMRLEFQLKIY
jgi:hypothetical protein